MTLATELAKRILRSGFNRIGLDITRLKDSPTRTLLGLKGLPIKTVVDVGANTGQFAKQICAFFPDAKIYCFEPSPQPFEALMAWANTQAGRVVPLKFAIGDNEGEAELLFHEDHSPSSSFLATTSLTEKYYPFTAKQKRISVRRTTLDIALGEFFIKMSPQILIKLDVQGFEDRVIAGGETIFKMASACIVEVCLDALYEGQAEFQQLLVMLDKLGFQYAGNLDQTYGKDGHCIFLDAMFLRRNTGNAPV